MNYKAFPEQYWTDINKTIENLKKQSRHLYAAFDADGTLWDTDLGENFFQYQIDHNKIPLPNSPWNHYLEMKKENNDPRKAYMWLAQINAGKNIDEVRQWADEAFKSIHPNPIFSEQKKLIQLLKSHEVKILIITASVKWAVEPGARAIGLTDDDVIGIETKISNGHITSEGLEPITYRLGKVEALMKVTNNQKPFLSSGNTMGDFELVQSATHIRLCVSAASRDDRLFRTEHELQQRAKENNWWGHRFI